MDPQSKELLEKTFALAEENNKMLRKIRHAQKVAAFLRSVYWVLVIGLGIGAFYFLKPFFDQTMNFFQSTGESITNLKNSLPF